MDLIALEVLSDSNIEGVRGIDHNCKGHTYAIKRADECTGVILLGEELEWDTDPEEIL